MNHPVAKCPLPNERKKELEYSAADRKGSINTETFFSRTRINSGVFLVQRRQNWSTFSDGSSFPENVKEEGPHIFLSEIYRRQGISSVDPAKDKAEHRREQNNENREKEVVINQIMSIDSRGNITW